jgi:UMF1 family MFS transporter
MSELPKPKEKLDRKAIFGWSMFDFANSAFTTVIVTAYFSIYFQNIVVPPAADGSTGRGSWLWALAQAISQAIVIITAPLVGALADFTGAKKKFLLISYLGCSLLTILLCLVGPGAVFWGMLIFILANICYSSGENIVGAFLPEISPPHLMGRISGWAWGLGYIGGIASLLLSVIILGSKPTPQQYSWVWIVTGFWFLLAGLPTFLFVRERHQHEVMPPGQTLATVGFHRLKQTLRHARHYRQLFRFLLIFVLISAGVTAVIAFASKIADETLHFDSRKLGLFLIWCNLIAVAGAWFWGWLQDKIGSRAAIQLSLLTWLTALVLVIFIKPAPNQDPSRSAVILFWLAGAFVGIGMGATSSSCRAIVGIFSPPDRSGEFFGLWGLAAKLGSIAGPMAFGLVTYLTNDIRIAELTIGIFFVAGLVLLKVVDEQEGRAAAVMAIESGPTIPS